MKRSTIIIIVALVVLAVVVLGSVLYYFYSENQKEEEALKQRQLQIEAQQRQAMKMQEEVAKEVQEEKLEIEEEVEPKEELRIPENITYQIYRAELKDVRGKNSTGEAVASYSEGNYTLKATFENLEDPQEGFFYEGWVVRRSPSRVLSSGKAIKENGQYVNKFNSREDLTDHTFYVLTIEPDDNDPSPAAHILEGDFTKTTNENCNIGQENCSN